MIAVAKRRMIMSLDYLRNQLTPEEQEYVETELVKRSKSTLVAYLLLIFFGFFGAHRFYLGKKNTAIIQLILGIVYWVGDFFYITGNMIGGILMFPYAIWALVDLFLTYRMVKQNKQEKEQEIIEQVLVNRSKASGQL
jgi:TM2 domain-containing membrane protein YozV